MKKTGRLQHIHVEPLDNGGAHLKVRHAMPPMLANQPMSSMGMDDGEENLGASTPEDAGAHVTRLLKAHQGQTGPSDNDADNHPLKAAFGRKKKF